MILIGIMGMMVCVYDLILGHKENDQIDLLLEKLKYKRRENGKKNRKI